MSENEYMPDLTVEGEPLAIREPPKVLVPIEVLEGESISESLVEFLAPAEVVLLGYHVLPDQTSTEQASLQFEDRARSAIDEIATAFRELGGEVETRVAFTHDRDATVDRVAADAAATAVLLPNPVGDVEEVVVPIRGAIDGDRLADLVATLLVGRGGSVTLWGLDIDEFDTQAAVDRVRETLTGRGLAAERIRTEVTDVDSPVRAVVDRSGEFDVIVMGEGGPGLLSSLFGDPSERVAEGAVAPVLVVRDR
ncbi:MULTISPECIES: universal stress protein [Halolamina]|uniref:Universal stress protein family protein n=1 Tax=Halolamina pelagica TaxID=699431 RepID=A0A1I5Q976_9EURY|nr:MULTISPECIES: universal stress protein [Halolamina]NHX35158.1 universal stress protein [Halolamina sp. R1-12]SFP42805.1 Universal stress protein family protein [Halolamina pelagica]